MYGGCGGFFSRPPPPSSQVLLSIGQFPSFPLSFLLLRYRVLSHTDTHNQTHISIPIPSYLRPISSTIHPSSLPFNHSFIRSLSQTEPNKRRSRTFSNRSLPSSSSSSSPSFPPLPVLVLNLGMSNCYVRVMPCGLSWSGR